MPTPAPRRTRPVILAVAMMLMSFMAMSGWLSGCTELRYYRSPDSIVQPTHEGADAEARAAFEKAQDRALDVARPKRLPLAAANLLLSGLLLVAATRALAGRKNARPLALQSLGANALYTIVAYALSSGYRGDLAAAAIDNLPRALLKMPPELTNEQVNDALTFVVWSMFRLQLLMTIGAYVVAWIALNSRRSRAFLDSAPEAVESSEDAGE